MPLTIDEKIQHALEEIKQAMGETTIALKDSSSRVTEAQKDFEEFLEQAVDETETTIDLIESNGQVINSAQVTETKKALGEYFDEEQLLDGLLHLCQALKDQGITENIEKEVTALLKESNLKDYVLTTEAFTKLNSMDRALCKLIAQNDPFQSSEKQFLECINAIQSTLQNEGTVVNGESENGRSGEFSLTTLDWFGFPVIEVPAKVIKNINETKFNDLKTSDLNPNKINACREFGTYYIDELSNLANTKFAQIAALYIPNGDSKVQKQTINDPNALNSTIDAMVSKVSKELFVTEDVAKDFILYGQLEGYPAPILEYFQRNDTYEKIYKEFQQFSEIKETIKSNNNNLKETKITLFPTHNNISIKRKNNGIQHTLSMKIDKFVFANDYYIIPEIKEFGFVESTVEIASPKNNKQNIQLKNLKVYPFHPAIKNLINSDLCKNIPITDSTPSVKAKLSGDETHQKIAQLRFDIKKTTLRKDILAFQELEDIYYETQKLSVNKTQLPEKTSKLEELKARQQTIAKGNNNPTITAMAELDKKAIAKLTRYQTLSSQLPLIKKALGVEGKNLDEILNKVDTLISTHQKKSSFQQSVTDYQKELAKILHKYLECKDTENIKGGLRALLDECREILAKKAFIPTFANYISFDFFKVWDQKNRLAGLKDLVETLALNHLEGSGKFMISSLKAQPTLVFMDSEEKPIEKQKEKIEEVDIADFMDYVWMEKPFFGESTKRVKLDNKENKNKENTAIKDIEPSNAQVMATGSSHRI